jgi:Na+/melibiose symporter-like transporter
MSSETWYERAAWIWFALVSASVLPLTIAILIDPAQAEGVWTRFGYALPATIAGDPTAVAHVEFISHWAATGTLGFDLFGLLIAVTAFRRGERWAWLAFCYWPVLFAIHFATYQSGFRYLQLAWLAGSVAALLATYRRAWNRPSVADPAGTREQVRSTAQ